ncbi:hypothetical protein EJ08DRAFT_108644 [Tothia fuscella]|uniref:Uncharacterized protein n=1 Tax=Tothia fuscella TaxID=1048955 RepID=A0A9P4NWP2_9PEZI|nr:hypothetical protein EJ08DRAFT_108644 [Tothia fuscella]
MAIQSCTLSDSIALDKTYLDRIKLRRELIATQTNSVVEANPVASDAVKELYQWIFGVYLPKRFPTMFSLDCEEKGLLRNKVTSEIIPLDAPADSVEALKILGSHVDTELLILLPTADANAAPIRVYPTQDPMATPYHLHAYMLTFPSGFDTPKKLGQTLAGIHAPVPGYSTKLEKSMDRFFSALPLGKIVKRANWSVQTSSQLFKLHGNHLSTTGTLSPSTMAPPTHIPTESELEEWRKAAQDVRPEECFLRCERQTLHRLERTGALVFGFKTYLYDLPGLRAEGSGEELARAVEGLGKGSVPGMRVYKREVIWGEKVAEFLRS